MIDNKGRLFGLINVIDLAVLVILAWIAIGGFCAYKKFQEYEKTILPQANKKYFLIDKQTNQIRVISHNDSMLILKEQYPDEFDRRYELLDVQ